MVDWDCGALPTEQLQTVGRLQVRLYPALVDRGDHVEVQSLDSLPNAQAAHHAGVRRLLMLVEAKALRSLRRNFRDLQQMRLHYAKVPPPIEPVRDAEGPADLLDDLIELAVDQAFLDDAWTLRDRTAFEHCREAGRPKLGPALVSISELVRDILAGAHAVRSALGRLTQVNWRASVEDMHEQLQRLVYQGFLKEVPPERLAHYPRYLDALQRRIEKLPGAALRDQRRLGELEDVQSNWSRRQRQMAARGQRDARLDEIRWMLEELRVSLFAQELKTAEPVSVKRIQRRWEALGL
jgi:ATP-dependent helicase HrpA